MSVLAIAETLAAIGVSVFVAVYFGTLKWIAISASLAPLLLLRTEKSTVLGIKLLGKVDQLADSKVQELFDDTVRGDDSFYEKGLLYSFGRFLLSPKRLAWGLLIGVSMLLMGLVIRILATLVGLVRGPIRTIECIPFNWYRVTCCLDSANLPEIVPGWERAQESAGSDLTYRRLIDMLKWVGDRRLRLDRRVALVLAIPGFWILCFSPVLLYRWSLKATSIVYTPLLWVVWASLRKIIEIQETLRRIRQSDLWRTVSVYSVIVLLAFATKIALMISWAEFATWWNATPLGRFSSIYVVPQELPIWQIAAAINAVLAIGLFVFAGEALLRMGKEEAWSEKFIERILRCSIFVRCLLTLYTVSCTLYITIRAASDWNLPGLGTKLFPWL